MITRITSVILSVLLITTQAGQAQSAPRNPKLSQLIDSLRDEDQKPATLEASKAEQAFKAATLRHIPFIKDILKKHGFPGYDLVGKTSSDNFWMLVQHSDADLPLQKQALQLMDKEVKKKNASGDKYAYLIDRIRINEGGKQVYGTQISWTTGAPVPKALENPESVDQRRKEVGMAPLADYLQAALDAHYEMNKNRPLADSLAELVKVDQIAASMPQGKYKEMSREDWQHYKDSVFNTHQQILEQIFNHYGYPGYKQVGKEGSKNFWLMVQHCDQQPAFQERVLTAMKIEVDKKNADPANYAYLVDRVMLNTGRKQVYATQVTYNLDSCQAIPKPLQDSSTVNQRRYQMGLESMEQYMNQMGEMHFMMNKDFYEKKGITKPKLYTVPTK